MVRRRDRKRVALLIETSNAYGRGLLRGIRAFAHEHGRWATYLVEQSRGQASPAWVAHWGGDGIIARIESPAIAKTVVASGLPIIDVSAARLVESLPWVETDDRLIAKLAFAHLADRGFKHFAFCGDDRFNWSKWRCEHFVRRVQDAGHTCDVLNMAEGTASGGPQREQEQLTAWLESLPKPVGIMACYDIRGRQIIDACRAGDIDVPDQVAVIGVDNDELLCDLTDPPLSSVQPDAHQAGYLAASLLAQVMSGRTIEPGAAHRVEPLGVQTRRSSDVLAIDDAEVSAAMRFIREHACEGINVEAVMDHVSLSRRVLESRFRKLMHRTPHEQIVQLQMERATQLLRETKLPLTRIAHACGFRHAEYLSVVFKKKLSLTPTQYRREHQPRD